MTAISADPFPGRPLMKMSETFHRGVCHFFDDNQILYWLITESQLIQAQIDTLFNISAQILLNWIKTAFTELCDRKVPLWRRLVQYVHQIPAPTLISRRLQMFDAFSHNPMLPEMLLADLFLVTGWGSRFSWSPIVFYPPTSYARVMNWFTKIHETNRASAAFQPFSVHGVSPEAWIFFQEAPRPVISLPPVMQRLNGDDRMSLNSALSVGFLLGEISMDYGGISSPHLTG
jgi:hypothetical protein